MAESSSNNFEDIPSTKPKNGNVELREDLITTAVRFLQSAKVRETPLSHRKAFLAKKGLTEPEIQEAITRAGSTDATSVMELPPVGTPYYQQGHPALMAPPPPPHPLPATWRDYAQAMVFVSGASYVAYKFVRGYVLPTWFNRPDPEQERMRRLDENMNDVHNGLKFLVDSVQQTLGVVQTQQETLNRLVNEMVEKDKTTATQERAIQELRNDIGTIKSLLLSRDQFPPLPSMATTTVSASSNGIPSAPAWQLPLNARQQQQSSSVVANVVNGTSKNRSNGTTLKDDRQFVLGASDLDDDEDGGASGDGSHHDEPYVSAESAETGGKTTPV